jgi:hypothetical protein
LKQDGRFCTVRTAVTVPMLQATMKTMAFAMMSSAFILQVACSDSAAGGSPVPGSPKATSACLLEGSLTLLGMTTEIKDCAQNDGRLPKAELEQYCEGLSQAAVQLGGTPSKITYLPACPPAPQGSCTGARIIPAGITAYYYKRDDLTGVKSSCETNGGVWR